MADIDFGGSPTDPVLVPLATATYLIALEDTGVGPEPLKARVVEASEIAPLASPPLTGIPTAPTAAPGTDTDQIATTAFVLANAGGGGDGWVYVELAADVTIDTAFQVILDFEPPANSAIEIEAKLIFGTAVNGDAARLRVAWPDGLVRSAGVGQVASSNTGLAFIPTSHIAGSTFSQNTTTPTSTFASFLAMFDGLMVTDGSPTGVFSLGIQAEVSGTDITAYAGSYLKYRVRAAP